MMKMIIIFKKKAYSNQLNFNINNHENGKNKTNMIKK